MGYEICKRCGRMFKKGGKIYYCEDCFEKNAKEYELIIKYIRKYPESMVIDIIIETGVSLKGIDCLVEDGSLSYVEDKLVPKDKDKDSESKDKMSIKKGRFHLRR
ncbi:MAG: hypothetical protein GX925_01140 [Clostridiales bacterium]|nr:hypothetical protein [Clostridiales bacterium]